MSRETNVRGRKQAVPKEPLGLFAAPVLLTEKFVCVCGRPLTFERSPVRAVCSGCKTLYVVDTYYRVSRIGGA